MYGEVLRDAMPALRLRRFRLSVASRLEAAGDGQAHDVVRAALWRLEDGQRPDPQRLLVAARAARAYSLEAAERLARAATTDGSSLPAVLLLAEILTHRGRGEEASGLLATLPPDSLAQEDRAAVLYCMALGQGLAVGDPGQGVAMVEGVLAADRAATDHLRALHASLLAFDARFADALTRGGDLVEDQGVAAPARTLGAVGVVGATYWQGHFDRAVSYADQLLPVARAARSEVPYGEASLNLIAITALIEKGDHLGAERRTLTMRRQAEADSDPFAMPRTEYLLGRLALYRGQAETAVRRFRRTVATAGPFDQFIVRHLWSMVARAAATLGDHAGAEEALAAGADLIQMKPYEPEWDLAEAAVLASRLNITEAIDRATWAASVAADWGEWNVAIAGYHDAARYGAARVVLPAIQSVPFVDGELPACYLEHVVALAANDGDALDAVARRFEGVGALGYAVEAADEASLAHRQGQQERAATRSAWHGRDLRDRCEEASSPWLTGAASSVSLTARERQVAALAMEGLPDAEIASRLGMSVRTAQTHLSRCYTKLGVHSRSQLASVLPGRTGLS
jgi:DNA-binding CsgD family transcriptional regulator